MPMKINEDFKLVTTINENDQSWSAGMCVFFFADFFYILKNHPLTSGQV
jgi:hypothetical protein